MAQFTMIKHGQKYRLLGSYKKKNKNGFPMINIELQIVGFGTKSVGLIRFNLFKNAVDLLKKTDIKNHVDFEKRIKSEISLA